MEWEVEALDTGKGHFFVPLLGATSFVQRGGAELSSSLGDFVEAPVEVQVDAFDVLAQNVELAVRRRAFTFLCPLLAKIGDLLDKK